MTNPKRPRIAMPHRLRLHRLQPSDQTRLHLPHRKTEMTSEYMCLFCGMRWPTTRLNRYKWLWHTARCHPKQTGMSEKRACAELDAAMAEMRKRAELDDLATRKAGSAMRPPPPKIQWAEQPPAPTTLMQAVRQLLRDALGMAADTDWAPSRWWRVVATRPDGHLGLWCETSDEAEAREQLKLVPADWTEPRLERLWEQHATEWRRT